MRRKKKTIKGTLVKSILEGKTFDLKEDTGGWKTVAELIANFMLRNLPERDRFVKLNDGFLTEIKTNLTNAIGAVEGMGYTVYKFKPDGHSRLEFISIDKTYREAERCEAERMTQRMENTCKHTIQRAERIFSPEKALSMKSKMRLILGNAEVEVLCGGK